MARTPRACRYTASQHSYLNIPFAKLRNACASLKLVINPTEARTAPLFLPSMHSRKSSSDSRLSWSGLVKHTSSSTREIPSAISPAPGLQKQPVRSEMLDLLACASMLR